MKKFIALTGGLVFLCCVLPNYSNAQAYIQYSHQDSSGSNNNMVKVVNGEAYVLQFMDGFGFGCAKLKKYSVNGTLLFSRDISLEQSVGITAMEVINGEVYLLAGKPVNVGCCGLPSRQLKYWLMVSKADLSGRTNNFDVSTLAVISNMDAGIKPSGTTAVPYY